MPPDLEIIIAAREPGPGLARTAASLTAQTDRRFSVLLCAASSVANGSPLDDAEKTLAAAGIAVRRVQPPLELKPIELWNWAHAQSQAGWLKPLPPGVSLRPAYVEKLHERIRLQPQAHLIRCECESAAAPRAAVAAPAPFTAASLTPAEFLKYFPAHINWIARPDNLAYRRVAWQAAGGLCAQLTAGAALNLNVTLALHHGLENIPEPLVDPSAPGQLLLNASRPGRVNLSLELWLIMRQARNYCLATGLPWTRNWLLPAACFAALGDWPRPPYG